MSSNVRISYHYAIKQKFLLLRIRIEGNIVWSNGTNTIGDKNKHNIKIKTVKLNLMHEME
jgi:hypothetical protein